MNRACVDLSTPNLQAMNISNDPSMKIKFLMLLSKIESQCKNQYNDECDIISAHIVEIKNHLIKFNQEFCKEDKNGVISLGDFRLDNIVKIISNLENRVPDDSANPEYRKLNLSERLLFNNYRKLRGDPKAFYHALCFYKKHINTSFKQNSRRNKINIDKNNCNILINDYNKPSNRKRLFSLNRCTGEVLVMPSSHGKGGGKGVGENSKEKANTFQIKKGQMLHLLVFLLLVNNTRQTRLATGNKNAWPTK